MTQLENRVVFRRSPRARRLSLRVDVRAGGIVVVMPKRVSEAAAADFLNRNSGWVMHQLAKLPKARSFAPGDSIPVLGLPRQIRHHPDGRGAVALEAEALVVTGGEEHVPRRVRDFLKGLARREVSARALATAGRLGLRPARVTVRDTATRWGSCSPAGALSFSWRLILAPEWVLDYVVAHEVAHLKEMNHGPRFWALVRTLVPEPEKARTWLGRHGGELHRYG
jgi:predicted metal-dependent hydrolase